MGEVRAIHICMPSCRPVVHIHKAVVGLQVGYMLVIFEPGAGVPPHFGAEPLQGVQMDSRQVSVANLSTRTVPKFGDTAQVWRYPTDAATVASSCTG